MACSICTKVTEIGDAALYRDAQWVAMPSGDKPGWVMLATREHIEWTWSMSGAQAASFGPAVARISEKIRATADASKVYLVGLGEAAIHCHFLLIPRVEGLGDDIRASLRKWGEAVGDDEKASRLAKALRGELAQ